MVLAVTRQAPATERHRKAAAWRGQATVSPDRRALPAPLRSQEPLPDGGVSLPRARPRDPGQQVSAAVQAWPSGHPVTEKTPLRPLSAPVPELNGPREAGKVSARTCSKGVKLDGLRPKPR